MENIRKKVGYNFGSILNIVFVPIKNVVSIPAPIDGGIIDATAITLEDIDAWINFAFTYETGRLKEEQVNTPTGVLYKITIDATVAKDNLNRFTTFYDMEFHQFLVLVKDANGNSKIVGYIDKDGSKFGMKFKTKSDTGEKRTALNSVDCQFYMDSVFRSRTCYNIVDLPINPDPSWVPDEEAIPLFPPEE